MIGTPEEVVKRIVAAQKACSFSEITIVPQFGIMPYDEAEKSTKLFAKEVLPIIHKMEAPLNADALPPRAVA
jgi:alkanesulfonate monooxygenase SsuD/methylene tetrahydromethanopterin reductase-like flavin-dependent oxidoreductase (luciferase family)